MNQHECTRLSRVLSDFASVCSHTCALQFKTIMYGGSGVPITESPYRVEMRKAAFWKGA